MSHPTTANYGLQLDGPVASINAQDGAHSNVFTTDYNFIAIDLFLAFLQAQINSGSNITGINGGTF